MCCTVDAKTQQRPKGRRSEEETRHIPFLVQSLLLIAKEQGASCSFSNWCQACTEKMLLPGAQDPSTGVGGAGLLLEVVGTSGLLALLAQPLDRKSRTTEREKAVRVSRV